MVQPDTQMILTNAIYFKGNWLQEFQRSATKFKCFHQNSNSCMLSYMMTQLGNYKYGYEPSLDAQVIQLLYEVSCLSNIINQKIVIINCTVVKRYKLSIKNAVIQKCIFLL